MNPAYLSSFGNHLWQSTLFAGVAGLLTLALRNNHARVRHWVWLAVSCKFLIPVSVLIAVGSHIQWRRGPEATQSNLSVVMDEVSQPFTMPATTSLLLAAAPPVAVPFPAVLWVIWPCGFLGIAYSWWVRWRRVRAAVRAASPMRLEIPVRVMSSPTLLEPGVFGVFRPVLLLPDGIFDRLTPAQLRAVIAHELCHVRHRDNLIAAIHMFVETVFWFHPLVWWIGKRMVKERERACDEEVLRLGNEPQVYAEGILNVCKLYVESPLVCVAGVTGSNLKKRIEAIMAGPIAQNLNLTRKLLLAVAAAAAVALPIAIGLLNAPAGRAQAQEAFDVASVRLNKTHARGEYPGLAPGGQRFTATYLPLMALIMLAYNVTPHQISGVPSSFAKEAYDIEARCERPIKQEQALRMLQTLLADRFKLTLHRETKEQPIYELVVANGGPKLRENPQESAPDRHGFVYTSTPMSVLALMLSQRTDRTVVDKTGLNGRYDFSLEYTPEHVGRGVLEGREPAPNPNAPSIFTAVEEQLGLKLDSQKEPVEFIVVDHAEEPSTN